MSGPRLLVVSGLPASGKTTLATALSTALRWPLVTKDDYKAILLDAAPPERREAEATTNGPLSFALMWHVAEVILRAGGNAVLETHFYRPQSEAHIRELAGRHAAQLAQIYCEAPLDELNRRHAARVALGKRPGIDRPFDLSQMPPGACWEPLNLGNAPLLRLDTTQPGTAERASAWLHELWED
ncbi:AAA family ATPase [Deinococcus taklimakanensis]|uniref:AAA family ATPase n=1 Tax=Deinococcus taklimakanensis TaxID=536443 RepID=A0ABW5P7V6_9DEIO